ncbi:MAG: SpoIIE family protein phosphatase [Lachnospiraceae bacterium]|nr:SpoIIE family protein phosphatase [Lachnospiraceae bacterium]
MKKTSVNRTGGLRLKLFAISAFLVISSIVVFALIGNAEFSNFVRLMDDTMDEQEQLIKETMPDMTRQTLKESFQKMADSSASLADREFWTMMHDMELLSREVGEVLENPERFTAVKVYPPNKYAGSTTTVHLLYSRYAREDDTETMEKIGKLGNVGPIMREIVDGSGILQDCIIALPEGMSIVADRIAAEKFDKDGNVMTFDALRRPWYAGAVATGDVYFSPVNRDYYTKKSQMMIGIPVYVNDELLAVCGGSISLDNIESIIDNASFGNEGFTCLVNQNGYVIFSQKESGELSVGEDVVNNLMESTNMDLVMVVEDALKGESGFTEIMVDDEPIYLAYAPLKTVGWTEFIGVAKSVQDAPADEMIRQADEVYAHSVDRSMRGAQTMYQVTLIVTVVLILLAVALSLITANQIVRPIKKLQQAGVRFIEREETRLDQNQTFFGDLKIKTGDEIEGLWNTMRDMEINIADSMSEIQNMTVEKEKIGAELSVATQIQEGMLPSIFNLFPDRKDVELYATMHPAKEVGGDFYDFFLVDDSHIAFVIGDVSGKGVPAALFMVISKTLIQEQLTITRSPGKAMTNANRSLCDNNEVNLFVTVWLGMLDTETGQLIYVNAGHNPPVLTRRGGDPEYLSESEPQLVMGWMDDLFYREEEVRISLGDRLYLYTDGVTEAKNEQEEFVGEDRLLAWMKQCGNLEVRERVEKIGEEIAAFRGEADQFDDITMLEVEFREYYVSRDDRKVERLFPAQSATFEEIRVWMTPFLERHNVPELILTQIILATEELFVNVVKFAYRREKGDVRIAVECTENRRAILTIADRGTPFDPTKQERPDIDAPIEERTEGGLGIFMVMRMMDQVTYDYIGNENVVRLIKMF